jgi:hypothetical protein
MGRREIAELANEVSDSAHSIERPAEQLAVLLGELKRELDGIGHLSEVETLRLQMTIDRVAKITTVLATVTSRVSDAEDAIRKRRG